MLNKQTENRSLETTPLALHNLTARFNLAGEFIIENAKGQVLDTAESLAQLTQQGHLKNVLATVWVPSQLVLLTDVFVPGKRQSDWMAALPYTLEESLSEPVENLHFVALNRNKEGVVSVAIVAHQWMQQWVETLQSLDLTHVQLVPECFRVPVAEQPILNESEGEEQVSQHWNVIAKAGVLSIRSDLYSGFSVREACLAPFVNVVEQTGKKIIQNRLSEQHLLNSQLDSNQSISRLTLRTNDYQAQSKQQKYWQDWRWPAVLLGLVLIALLVATWQKTQTLAKQTQHYQAQTERLFKEMFPDVKRIVNIKMQTQTRLNNQQGGGQKNNHSLVALLKAVEPLFKADPNIKINRLQWQMNREGGLLSIMVSAQQTQQLQTLVSMSQQQRSARAINIELELKNVSPNLVEGVFHVTAK
ncbi:MAG: type II secretion system protein GspL [Thiomicrorhabdus sp.]|nr:type II secretion system protein GspL [Thiomicrorhabdus sp.]